MLQYNYKSEAESVRHYTPMAEDFFEAFGLGDDKTISPADLASITLSYSRAQIRRLEKEVSELKTKMQQLERKGI